MWIYLLNIFNFFFYNFLQTTRIFYSTHTHKHTHISVCKLHTLITTVLPYCKFMSKIHYLLQYFFELYLLFISV